MFQITAETCRAFTFAEVLIMAAVNLESIRLSFEGRVYASSPAAQSRDARHIVRTDVPKAPQF